jgi:hypothetical protein
VKRQLGTPKRRWEENIKTVLSVINFEDERTMKLANVPVHYWALILADVNLQALQSHSYLSVLSHLDAA